jgi:glycosyltransferase involved in cell wall biosynthesis
VVARGARVLFVSFDIRSRFGGIQRFDQRVVRCLGGLRDAGADVRVISLRDAASVPADGITPIDIAGARGSKPRAAIQFVKTLLSFRPDLILYGHVLISPLALIARALRPGVKNVMFAHGIEVWDDPQFARVSRLNRFAVRSGIDQILAVSRFTAERIKRVFGVGEDVLQIFPNAVDVTDITGRSQSPQKRPGNGRILTVARLDEWEKGIGAVIRALPLVIPRVGKVEYTIVGDGKLRADMEALAREVGVAEHVRFAGRVSDDELLAAYRDADAFVMPSLKEGFGIVYLEAWQHQLPVLAGDRDAGGEVVENGVDGLVVDPTSTQQIADAIVKLLTEPGLAARLGAAGRAKLEREYSHERFAERFQRAVGTYLPPQRGDDDGNIAAGNATERVPSEPADPRRVG